MKLINTLILLFLVSCSSSSQYTCEIEGVLNDFLNTEVSYSVDKEHVDLTSVFKDNRTAYIGFIGENKKRIDFYLVSIERDLKNPLRYVVKGKTKPFSETSKPFSGEFLLDRQYKFSEKLDEDVSYADGILKQGFSILSYELNEDSSMQNTGVFKGHVFVSWYVDTTDSVNYDDTLDFYPSYSNCQFFGSWLDYETDKKVLTAWGQHRVPCSGDLDIGAAEFSPNPKYYNQGWETYNSEPLIEEEENNHGDVLAKIVDKDGYVNMRKEKGADAEIILQVQSDSIVKVLNRDKDWWLISYRDKLGYIHKSRLEILGD